MEETIRASSSQLFLPRPEVLASNLVFTTPNVRIASRGVSITSVAQCLGRKIFPLVKPKIQREGAKYTRFGLAAVIVGASIGILFKEELLISISISKNQILILYHCTFWEKKVLIFYYLSFLLESKFYCCFSDWFSRKIWSVLCDF